MATPNGKTPRTTHQWLQALYQFLDWLLALLTGGGKLWPVDAVLTAPLPANTYANGTSGVGATITLNAAGALPTVDGYTLRLGDRVLVTGETTLANNGLYYVSTLGTASVAAVLTRDPNFDQSAEVVAGTKFGVKNGTLHGGKAWVYTGISSPTMGTTAMLFHGSPTLAITRGSIPASRLAFSVNPTANDTIAIGGKTFTFVASLGATAAQVQVLIGGNAAATLTNLIDAINGNTANSTGWKEASSAFAGAVIADAVTSTVLRIRNAISRGNRATAGVAASTALTASVTGGASAWSIANLNAYGKVGSDNQRGEASITVTSAMITATAIHLEFPFPVGGFMVQVLTSAGILRLTQRDAFTISGNAVVVTLNGSSAPDIQNTDVLTVRAWQ